MTKYYSRSKGKFVDIATMPDQYVRNAFVKMCGEETKIYVNWKKLAEDNFISGVDDLDKIESLTKENKELKGRQYNSHDKDGRINDYYKEYAKLAKQRDDWKEKAMNMVEKSSHEEIEETLKDTIKSNGELIQLNKQLKASLRQANLTPTVSTQAYDIAWQNIDELNDQVKSLLDRNAVLSRMYNASLSSNVTKGDVKMFSEIPNNPDGDMFICQLRQYLNKESYKIRVRGQYLKDEVKETEGWKPYERGQPIEKSKCLRVYVDKK
jgi:uncharacterized phage infection (PIP) family protein YhgE